MAYHTVLKHHIGAVRRVAAAGVQHQEVVRDHAPCDLGAGARALL